MKKLQIEYIKIEDIIPYKNNPRNNDKAVEIVEKSIKEFGFKNPIVLDKNNEIIVGHTRLRAAKKLGLTEVPVIYAEELTPEQVKAFRIMDNKSSEIAQWDLDLLKVEFESMSHLEFTGFTEAEIDKILDPKEKISMGNIDPKHKIEIGDLYQLGDHRLICGDSTKAETYEKLMPKGTDIQCVFTDPPYGVSYSGTNNPNGRDWSVIEGDGLYNMLKDCFVQINQYLIKNGAVYVFHASSNQIIFEKALNYAGLQVKQQLIWNKHHILGHSHYHWCHEPMFYCSRMNENPEWFGTRANKTTLTKIIPEEMSIEELIRFVNKTKEESTVWDIKKDSTKDYIHPTQKPTRLAQRAILNSSKKGDKILDPFAGSGSTLMACEEKGRKCYTIELDPTFCSHIIDRWEKHTNKKAQKLHGIDKKEPEADLNKPEINPKEPSDTQN
ncbi:MAG TPA: DNA methyltransferase [Candidatus Glassbacteria bacterium]|nr:DNA methyltransferase [Candidatus Glassbacteria bacterium]